MSLGKYTIKQVESMLHNGEISASELVDLSLQQISSTDETIKAFLTMNEEAAKSKAKQLDAEKTYANKLAAIPHAMKDNIVTKGVRTTCASKMLEKFIDPLYDATIVEKTNEADAIMVGKVNLDEFAMGSTTETSAFQKTTNPWNKDHTPGGSSGGSAAAVASGQVMFSIGTDTGGSIRQPAAFCGVVGMKPTYGLISRYGVVAMAPSLDQAGPITKTVADNARVLEVIAGYDKRDMTSANKEIPSYASLLTENIKGLKIAVPKELLDEGVADEIKEAVQKALQTYEKLGATWDEVSLPHIVSADAVYYSIAYSESASSLARYDGVRYGHRSSNHTDMIDMYKQSRGEGFGDEVKRRLLIGTTLLTGSNNEAYFRKAQKIRTLIKNDFAQVFENYDLIIGPTTARTAYKLGEEITDTAVLQMAEQLVVPANLAGLPAMSLPCGFSEAGLPIGLQLIGNHFAEQTIYNAGYAFEQATNYHQQLPTIGGGQA